MIEGKRIVAVGGGKGGVGKSVVSCNLAVGYALAGRSTVLVDADLGAPNLHTMLGADSPPATVGDLLENSKIHLSDVLVDTTVCGLKFAHGAAPILGVANPKFTQKQRLIREIERLDAEVLVVDLGAGVNYNVIDFFINADVKIAVVTPQITSMHNAYGFVKNSLHRVLQRSIAGRPGYNGLFKTTGASEVKIDALLERVAKFDSRYIDVFEPLMKAFQVQLLGNMLDSERELNVLRAMQRMVRDFLGIEARVAGGLRRDPKVQRSINQRRPFLLDDTSGGNGAAVRSLVSHTLNTDLDVARQLRRLAEERASKLPKKGEAPKRPTPMPQQLEQSEGQFADELKGRERSEPRYPCNETLLVRIGSSERVARLVDISCSGARLVGLPALRAKARLELRLPAPDAPWEWLAASVRYYEGPGGALGCRFESFTEPGKAAVTAFVDRLAEKVPPLSDVDPAATAEAVAG